MMGLRHPDFAREGRDWPLREWSTFRQAGGLRWHVQVGGSGPVCLLVHGTGAATHSWRHLAPRLASRFTVVAMDLPGHGFTGTPRGRRVTLDAMARLIDGLLVALNVRPALVVGHSAGAAIALAMALAGRVAPAGIVSLNGALEPFGGPAGPLFSLMAKALFANPLVPRLTARAAQDRARVVRLIENTGSRLDAEGIALYQALFAAPAHVAGAIAMMASWDLKHLVRELPRLKAALLLVAAEGDTAVPPSASLAVERLVPGARRLTVEGLGHLAHEEDAERIARHIVEFALSLGGRRITETPALTAD
ncbi:alpha/beta fold hydrolase BchO [Acuticoccus sp.]|uniref:alpha/beta fold hydrolase BchO n=1 Tax=Acuticoccus sp. TaxID=1904378 RepID=UPI003B51EB65